MEKNGTAKIEKTTCGIDQLDISPVRSNSKHQMTPMKTRSKMLKKDKEETHTICSTPNRFQGGTQSNGWNSPSDSFSYSQENLPEVVWDYTSPKLPKGSKRKEIKITVDEFLKNLTYYPVPECNSQTSNYIRLLEKWMTKQNTPVIKRPPKNVKRDNKKRSRRVLEEIKLFMESIQKKNEAAPIDRNEKQNIEEKELLKTENASSSNLPSKKLFFKGDSSENDSIDDLWGEMDNSFIIKATQQLDVSYSKHNKLHDKNKEIISTIPETIANKPKEFAACQSIQHSEEIKCDQEIIDSDYQAQMLLTQIMNYDWESDSDNEDWDNGFIEEDEALSLIPDEVLCGSDPEFKNMSNVIQNEGKKCESLCSDNVLLESSTENKINNRKNNSEEISFNCIDFEKITCSTVDISQTELFNNFEDESFGDESILCKPEVLSWIDEVESQVSLSQPKCTPEEIEKKKDEAIQRRKRNKAKSKF